MLIAIARVRLVRVCLPNDTRIAAVMRGPRTIAVGARA
jgi:hypothetical protein